MYCNLLFLFFSAVKMSVGLSETLLCVLQTTGCYMPEDSSLHNHHPEKVKFCICLISYNTRRICIKFGISGIQCLIFYCFVLCLRIKRFSFIIDMFKAVAVLCNKVTIERLSDSCFLFSALRFPKERSFIESSQVSPVCPSS